MIRADLPILALMPAIAASLREHNRLILEAPPGAGKTTGLPLALREAGFAEPGKILILEPRRLAAKAAALRMAHLLGESVGESVGYSLRLERKVSAGTKIECVTTGLFLRRIEADLALSGIACLLFDEFHERGLEIDLALALALEAQAALRPDLKILILSATLAGIGLERILPEAPRLTSQGRTWPINLHYLGEDGGADLETRILAATRLALRDEKGDILIFLPGQREIRRVKDRLARSLDPGIALYPLHGDLDLATQERALRRDPEGRRRIVLASGIAETSLTLDNIAIVIDSGLRRAPRYDPRSGLTHLATSRVALANAQQRAGRAGRLGPGHCYRLWSAESERGLLPHPPPEIVEADLTGFLLELALWGESDPAKFAFIDPPPAAALAEARSLLLDLAAIDERGRATDHGRAMAALGLHPRLAHMILAAKAQGLGALAIAIAASLGERDIAEGGIWDGDLRTRLEKLAPGYNSGGKAPADPRLMRMHRQGEIWRRQIGIAPGAGWDLAATGRVLALAYPDRIAKSRGRDGQFRMANGRGARIDPLDPLAREDFLAIASLGGNETEARIFLAAPLTLAEIERDFADRLKSEDRLFWNAEEKALEARREWRLGQIAIRTKTLPILDNDAGTSLMIAALRDLGIAALPWNEAARKLRARVAFLRGIGDPGANWPDWSDAKLLETLETWLGPHLGGRTRLAHLADLDLAEILLGSLDWPMRQRLDRLAPTHVAVPSGSRIAIDYSEETAPILAVRLQEMFGAAETPSLAEGRVPLILHLLSPAGRPVQVTRDLGGFWKSSYRAVRADLRGQYPRHDWPEDPLSAIPTRRAKPRSK